MQKKRCALNKRLNSTINRLFFFKKVGGKHFISLLQKFSYKNLLYKKLFDCSVVACAHSRIIGIGFSGGCLAVH